MSSNLIEREHTLQPLSGYDETAHESTTHSSSLEKLYSGRRLSKSWIRLALVSTLLIVSFASGWWWAKRQDHELSRTSLAPTNSIVDSEKIIVTGAPVSFRPIQRFVEAVGTLHAYEEVTLSSKQEGRVVKIYHDLSSVVKPGELLLELDATDARLAYEQAERAVQTELAKWGFQKIPDEQDDLGQLPTVVSARLKSELAKSRLQRMNTLKTTNSVSAEDLEQSRSEALVQESEWQNQLLMAKSAAATARFRNAELAIADQRLKDIAIRVPIPSLRTSEGEDFYTISERLVSEGTLVRPGTEVFKLVMGRTLKLKLSVPEAYSGQIQPGQIVSIMTGASETASTGKVARISPAIDRTTRTFLVEVEVANESSTLKPGGFAKAKILVGLDELATTIPMGGLYSFAGVNKIFIEENGKAREIKVSVGEQAATWVEIVGTKLAEGTVVVTSGQRLLSDGAAITIRRSESSELRKSDSSKETGQQLSTSGNHEESQ